MLGLAVSFIIVGDIGRKGDGIVPGWPVQWGEGSVAGPVGGPVRLVGPVRLAGECLSVHGQVG